MMSTLNKVMLIGRLGRDPEKRSTTAGATIVNLSVGTNHSYTNPQTNEKVESTEWSRVVLFRQSADFAAQYARKGQLVYVEGRLQTRKWEDSRTGQDRYMTEIIGREFRLLERMQSDGDSMRASQPASQPAPAYSQPSSAAPATGGAATPDEPLDDIPW